MAKRNSTSPATRVEIPAAVAAHIEHQRARLFQLAALARAANLTVDSAGGPDMGHVLDLIESLVEEVNLGLDSMEIERPATAEVSHG